MWFPLFSGILSKAQMIDEEQQKVKIILSTIKQMLQEEPDNKKRVIQEQGLKVVRFNQIVEYILQNPCLQQQVQQYKEMQLL